MNEGDDALLAWRRDAAILAAESSCHSAAGFGQVILAPERGLGAHVRIKYEVKSITGKSA